MFFPAAVLPALPFNAAAKSDITPGRRRACGQAFSGCCEIFSRTRASLLLNLKNAIHDKINFPCFNIPCSPAAGLHHQYEYHRTKHRNPLLTETFKTDFLIGAALNATQIEEKDLKADRLIKQQFNAVTPENVMKAEIIHPGWDKYNFDLADKLVAFAQKNNIKVNAHNLNLA